MNIKPVRLVPDTTSIAFLDKRKFAFVVSAILILGSFGLFIVQGLNFGIDFRGGTLIEVRTDGPADLSELRGRLEGANLGDFNLQTFGADDEVLIRVQAQEGVSDAEQPQIVPLVQEALGAGIELRRSEFVGPTVGQELIEAGALAVGLSLFGILVYIWFRFEWQFGVAAVVALMHDVIATLGFFALLQLDFNLSTVAAVLTVAGYSINDTVVVFDRVRENLRKYKTMPLVELFNLSVNETLTRTLLTSVTTLLALIALFVFGGAVIGGFTIALIWGVLVGTYSSIFVATPLLLSLNINRGQASDADPSAPERTEAKDD